VGHPFRPLEVATLDAEETPEAPEPEDKPPAAAEE